MLIPLDFRRTMRMKTVSWTAPVFLTAAVCPGAVWGLSGGGPAAAVEIRSDGKLIAALPLNADRSIRKKLNKF